MCDAADLALEVRSLARAVADLQAEQAFLLQRLVRAEDRANGGRLLSLAYLLVGQNLFTLAGLHARATQGSSLQARAVAQCLADLSTQTGGLRNVGRLLQRIEGVPLEGVRLVGGTGTREGRRWHIEPAARVSDE
ncbi:MAG: hypothetical protein RLY71_3262 [Pseudomonadota bacterium]|jgi:hypothetical protein